VKHYIGSYLAQMNGADAIVFTGGIGENSHEVRERICTDLDVFGIALDKKKNKATVGRKEGDIATEKSRVRLWVIPTNEELLIARDTVRCVKDAPRRW
jgi:acetate kinase